MAYDLLSRREHTSGELRQKLGKRGVPEEEIERTLHRLMELGVVDDRRAAELLIQGELRKRPQGLLSLRTKLQRRGLPKAIVRECLADFDENWEEMQAREASSRWCRRRPKSGQWKEALVRHLRSRGFGWGAIRYTVESLPEESSNGRVKEFEPDDR